jgi:hypothetical protein
VTGIDGLGVFACSNGTSPINHAVSMVETAIETYKTIRSTGHLDHAWPGGGRATSR